MTSWRSRFDMESGAFMDTAAVLTALFITAGSVVRDVASSAELIR